jgi:hypothetical protein
VVAWYNQVVYLIPVTDKFEILKAKYSEQIRTKERELSELKAKLRIIQELDGEASAIGGTVAVDGKYSNLGLTESVLDAVATLGQGVTATGSTIAKYLLSQGFKPKGNNFQVSVGTTLKRLADRRKIQTKSEAGKRFYSALDS